MIKVQVDPKLSEEAFGQQLVDQLRQQGLILDPAMEVFLKMPLVLPKSVGGLEHLTEKQKGAAKPPPPMV